MLYKGTHTSSATSTYRMAALTARAALLAISAIKNPLSISGNVQNKTSFLTAPHTCRREAAKASWELFSLVRNWLQMLLANLEALRLSIAS